MTEYKNQYEFEGIAIIGMAGRFPGADSIEALWKNLCDGIELIRFFKDEELDPSVSPWLIGDKNYIKSRGILNNIESFDAGFFNCLPREAQIMDPQVRVFLEVAWESLERAGYIPGVFEGKIGIFSGKGYNSYYANNIFGRDDLNETFGSFQAQLLNEKDFFSTQVSYKLNLTGPSININNACSTSLVAVCLAFDSLFSYQCDIAIAGGVSIFSPQNIGYLYQEGNIASSDGHCRPFDRYASGTLPGNGVGIVVLKRLSEAIEDGDVIYAVIKGCGLNNDGSNKMSFTAPGIEGQAEAIMMAQSNAGITAEKISYIEAHGTATPLGDPVEIEALSQAFRSQTDKKQFCAIGSIKGNVGHLDSAAGVTGLIKTALALYNKKLPPSINFTEPNPKIDFNNSPFFVNKDFREWHSEVTPRRAGVSSFGFGGTNAHVVLEEAPFPELSGPSRKWHLLPFSARSEGALNTSVANMAKYLSDNQELNLADVAFTLQIGRKAFAHRRTVVCSDMDNAIAALRSTDSKRLISTICDAGHRDVVFMFSGQGAQYANMGLDLYKDEPIFREQIDYCSEILKTEISIDLRQLLYPAQDKIEEAEEKLKETSITQPALFTIEFALARLLMKWGIRPQAFVGHSIGE
jgi:acyl transferase domain-containing protein